MENKQFTPTEYFEYIKEKKNKINNNDLKNIYDNCLKLLNKYVVTGQVKGALKLKFHLETLEKEKEVVKLGIDTFVYKDDIEDYIDNVSNDVVKIIELENYEREIPDEIVEALEKVKDKFTRFYVVFTDYTGNVEKQVEKERREKDPILFGTFEDKKSDTLVERFYYIGDWVDEYCDLTLDKMVCEMKKENKDILRNVSTPKTLDELKGQLEVLEEKNNRFRMERNFTIISDNNEKKKGMFQKVKTFFRGCNLLK